MARTSLPVTPAVAELFPGRGLRRGTITGLIGSRGTTSLTLALLAEPLRHGAWGAVVGWPELGLETASELGVRLDRLALVPSPGSRWLDVVASLVDSLDLVVMRPSSRIAPSVARRLAARVRERGCVVLVVPGGRSQWPESFDVTVETSRAIWGGLGTGFGTLGQRTLAIQIDGRRVALRRQSQLVLPSPDATVAQAITTNEIAADGAHDDLAITG